MTDDHLSDEQLRQLLKDAEHRLKDAKKNQAIQTQTTSLAAFEKSIPKVAHQNFIIPYIKPHPHGAQVERSHVVSAEERKLASGIRKVEDPVAIKTKAAKAKKASAGSDWYNLPKTVVTPELRRDLQLLRMRGVLDPHRHYKKESSRPQIPEFSQVGTIIEGPTEYFSARLSNKDRKRTFVEEVLAGENSTHRFKSKYQKIQEAKTSGKKAHFKKMKELRRGGGLKGR